MNTMPILLLIFVLHKMCEIQQELLHCCMQMINLHCKPLSRFCHWCY